MWLVSVTRSQVWMGSRCVKLGVIALTLSYWSLEVQHGTSWQRTLGGSEKELLLYIKMSSTAQTAQNTPNMRESCSRAVTLLPAWRLFTQDTASPRWHPCCGPRADITTKAQMTPHIIFVHQNESWNNSFILHYWQRTILTLTLVTCPNAIISGHCLCLEMKTAL